MSGTRVGMCRSVAIGVALALAVLLLGAREASAAKYEVAQCGWHIGADAGWADTTGGAKFRPDAWCVPPAGADPFNGVHMRSLTTGGGTISGTRFARWRWEAPPGGAISRFSGTWWHALHDGFQHRIGAGTWSGGFTPFATAAATDVTPRPFVGGFAPGVPAVEARLLCARAESSWCGLSPGSWAGVRGLTLTVEDNTVPGAGIGGDLVSGGWRRGTQSAVIWGADTVSGIRFGETFVDGSRVAQTEYGCAKVAIGSDWKGTRMRPCELAVSATHSLATTSLADGTHTLYHCVVDFAGNRGCGTHFQLRIDNNPPTQPLKLNLAGAQGWRRVNKFDFSWVNPGQGPASPIGGAYWRITGPAGYDTGAKLVAKRDIHSIADRSVPRAGAYRFHVWLRDEAGNSASSSAVDLPVLFDDVAPGIAFEPTPNAVGPELPKLIRAQVHDAHSGPAAGDIFYRRLNAERWIELPTKLQPGEAAGAAQLVAQMPADLDPGTYVFRAVAADAAGNTAASTRRADGTEMALRRTPPPVGPGRAVRGEAARSAPGAKTRIFAKLRWRRLQGERVAVPFAAGAALSGRLVDADGAGLAGRRLRVVSRPSRGALARRRVAVVRTGAQGGFRLALPAGPSRRVTVGFRGEPGLSGARRAGMILRVRGAVALAAAPRRLRTGELVRFRGRVRFRGAAVPRRGKLVAVQYFEQKTRRWRPVLVTRSDHSGRFNARYRFRYVTGTAQIRLRAVALAEERWPYAPGASAPVTLRVSG